MNPEGRALPTGSDSFIHSFKMYGVAPGDTAAKEMEVVLASSSSGEGNRH